MPVDLKSKLLPALWTAVLYAATGWLSLQICIPPDYVSLMFLPAGVALGMVLTQGAWALPGVALGSLAVQWMAGQQAGLEDGLSWTLLMSPLGAALQAWLGAWLARRWVGYPDPVETPQHVTLLLLGVGPLSTLVNASLSVPVLVLSGLIPPGEALFSWWTWWLGDAVGAVLGLPLLLVFLGQSAAAWRSRRLSVAMPLLLALLVVGAVVYETKNWEDQRIRSQLSQYAQEQGGLLQRRLDAQNDSVQAIARVMQISRTAPEVPQAEAQTDFSITVRHWLDRYGGTQNFGWSPLVQQADRAAYEAGRWPIKGRSATGETFAAALRNSYLPITLVEPLASNAQALGLDVAVLPATADSVAGTRTTGQPRVSEGIRLVQEVGEQRGVVMYQAVFRPHSTVLKGVVSAVFRMDDVLQALGTASAGARPDSCLVDPRAAVGNRRLAGPVGCDAADWARGPMSVQLPLQFGGREWLLLVRANVGFLNQARDLSAWAMVALSLLCVGLLGAFLLVITGQTRRTQALVEQRTLELAALAHYDSLTGLPNRSQWVSRGQAELQQAQQTQQPLAVLFLDLDHFKHINDTLGHALGDELLQAVSQRLQPCLESHHMLARIGGDEFVALLPQLQGPDEAAQVAERLRRALQAPLYIQGHEINLSASIGIACYPQDGDTLDHLLKHADTAMYVAKDAGRNGYQFFMKEMNARVSRRMFLENNLRRALERDELFLVYQPQIDAASGRVAGVEALVRWRHPDEGLIPPDRFIPVAEDCGLIEPLGAWVLHQACRQLQDWTHLGETELMMAINISPMQFRKSGFIDTVRHALSASGVDPARVELEITETLLMQPLKDLDNRLRELADMGLTFALDDFGTGYSSLGYLKRLPISRIKLDKSFVADLPGDVEDEAITRATLSMAKDLGLRCVAEGVETEAQQQFLTERGCDSLQGYLFARPMPADECRDWLRRYRREWAQAQAAGRESLAA